MRIFSAGTTMLGAAALMSALLSACHGPPAGGAPSRATDGGRALTDASRDGSADASRRPPNPIELENQQPGTTAWAIDRAAANHEVEGYASLTSAAPGDEVKLFVNVNVTHSVHWELFRLGYYAGLGGRWIASGDPVSVSPQTACPVNPTTGLVECAWQPTFTLTIDQQWVTGQYLVKLVRDDGYESYVPLVVRELIALAPLLYQSSVNTWQAYNAWGGTSLYDNLLPQGSAFKGSEAARVSFDRPYQYARPWGEGHPETEMGAGQLFLAERYMLEWLEMKGYDVAYVTNVDIEDDPLLLAGRAAFLVVGHDEYWTSAERLSVQLARNSGLSLGFFGANDAYWRVRLEPATNGTPRRIVTCYKGSGDPQDDTPDGTHQFRYSPFAEPEDGLIGQMYELSTNLDAFPLVVGDASHWVYSGTGLRANDTLPHLVGYEWDHVFRDRTSPPVEIAAASPAFSHRGWSGVSNVTSYAPTPTSVVFSAGTILWSWGLGKPGYADSRVAKMTENVLSRAGIAPRSETVVTAPAPPTDVGDAATVTLVAGSGTPGTADGVGAAAQFNSPAGVTADAAGNLFVTEARNHRIRKITPDGTVSTLAGCGPDDSTTGDYQDGFGSKACFSAPLGIVAAPDGTLYVADSGNNCIRAVDPAGHVTTYAGTGSLHAFDSRDRRRAGIPYPRALTLAPDGTLYVVSTNGDIRSVDASGVHTLLRDQDELSGIAVGADGHVYVIETSSGRVSMLGEGALIPLVNPVGTFGDQPGPGTLALLRPADGLILAGSTLFVSDSANYKVRRVALTPDHTVTTFVGSGLAGLDLGTGATARVVNPRGLALTPRGIIIADSGNHRILRATLPSAEPHQVAH